MQFDNLEQVYEKLRVEFFDRITTLEKKVEILTLAAQTTVPHFSPALDTLNRQNAARVFMYANDQKPWPEIDAEMTASALAAQEAMYNRTLPPVEALRRTEE